MVKTDKNVSYHLIDQDALDSRPKMYSKGQYGSIHTGYVVESTSNKKSKYLLYISHFIIILCVLTGDMARGIIFPTLWLRVRLLGGDRVSQGLAVSAFSAGRILSSPPFGALCESIGHRPVLLICNAIIILGCMVYSFTDSLNYVLLGQFVIGFGAGSLGVTRSYVADFTDKTRRTEYMAYLTAVQYAGFTVTPILGAMLAAMVGPDPTVEDDLISEPLLTEYNVATMFLAGCAFLCMVLLALFFQTIVKPTHEALISSFSGASIQLSTTSTEESPLVGSDSAESGPKEGQEGYQEYNDSMNDITNNDDDEHFEYNRRQSLGNDSSNPTHLIIGGCLLNMTSKGSIGVFETLVVVAASSQFQWGPVHAGLTVSICGLIGVINLLLFSLYLRYISDFNMVQYGLIGMALSCFLMIPMFDYYPEWEFYTAILLMYSFFYPIGHTAVLGVFSKVLKSGSQGTWLGVFGSAGSFARILFPILAGVLSNYWGSSAIYVLMAVLLVTSSLLFAKYKNLVASVIMETN